MLLLSRNNARSNIKSADNHPILLKNKSSIAHQNQWPPPYSLIKHPRAKHVRLRTSLKNGLEITVPPYFNPKNIREILEKHKGWIEKEIQKLIDTRENFNRLPDEIPLRALEKTWKVHYILSHHKVQILERPQHEVVLHGKIGNSLTCKKILLDWIKDHAKDFLFFQLNKISKEINLPYSTVHLRNQRTRWGSCSEQKSINLNYKLIFLPKHLVNYLMIHELCHTIHLNHKIRFWSLVKSFDPNFKQNRVELSRANNLVPGWVP